VNKSFWASTRRYPGRIEHRHRKTTEDLTRMNHDPNDDQIRVIVVIGC